LRWSWNGFALKEVPRNTSYLQGYIPKEILTAFQTNFCVDCTPLSGHCWTEICCILNYGPGRLGIRLAGHMPEGTSPYLSTLPLGLICNGKPK